jgi:hypothetical protein
VVDFSAIGDVGEWCTLDKGPARWRVCSAIPLPQNISEFVRHGVGRDGMQLLAVVELQASMSGAAKGVCLFQHCIEYRRELAGRGVDDLQYFGGRGLLLQRLARLGQEPRILHCNHRLRRKILQ